MFVTPTMWIASLLYVLIIILHNSLRLIAAVDNLFIERVTAAH